MEHVPEHPTGATKRDLMRALHIDSREWELLVRTALDLGYVSKHHDGGKEYFSKVRA